MQGKLLSLPYKGLQNPGSPQCPRNSDTQRGGWKGDDFAESFMQLIMYMLPKSLKPPWLNPGFPAQTWGSHSTQHSVWGSFPSVHRNVKKKKKKKWIMSLYCGFGFADDEICFYGWYGVSLSLNSLKE